MFSPTVYSKISARTLRIIIGIFIAGTIIGVGCSTVFRAGFDIKLRTDLTIYKAAGQAVLNGTNLYTVENERTWFFTSPPIVAILCLPLTWVSVTWGALLIYALSIGMLALIALLSLKLIPPERRHKSWKIIGWSFAICSIYFSDVLTRGQFGILVLLCLIITLYGWIKEKPALAGWALGFAVAIKVTPAALLPIYFLYKKEYRIFLWTCVSACTFGILIPSFFFGLNGTLRYILEWVERVPLSVFPIPPNGDELYGDRFKFWRQIHDPFIFRNQSLYAVFVRLLRSSQDDMLARGVLLPRLIASATSFAMLIVSAFTLHKKQYETEEKALAFSVPIILLLVASTLAWTHYFSCLYIAFFAVLTAKEISDSGVLKSSLFFAVLFMFLGYAFKPLGRCGFILWSAVTLWAGIIWTLGKNQRSRKAA